MRLLLVTENWPPRVGGIERYLSGLTHALRVQGAQVNVVAPAGKSEIRNPKSESEVVRRRFFWPLLKPAWLPLLWYLMRRHKAENYQAVLCGKALFEGLVGLALKKRYGIPYVVFTYAMEIAVWQQDARTRRKLSAVLREAAIVCYINEMTKHTLGELGVSDEGLLKLAPALPEAACATVREEHVASVLKKYAIKVAYILSAGRLIPRKGFDALLAAFAALDQMKFADARLVIAGDGPQREELLAQARRELVETSVHVLTDVSDEELMALYAGASVFALVPTELPGDFEGFGIVYLEAAAQGVPAVASKTGGAQEAVLHEQTGLHVPPDDVPALRDALARLLGDKALGQRLGEVARERVRQQFLWPARAAVLQARLSEIIKEKKAVIGDS